MAGVFWHNDRGPADTGVVWSACAPPGRRRRAADAPGQLRFAPEHNRDGKDKSGTAAVPTHRPQPKSAATIGRRRHPSPDGIQAWRENHQMKNEQLPKIAVSCLANRHH
jgi:hypothetical protein